jgi:trans-aconitate methyltransferase
MERGKCCVYCWRSVEHQDLLHLELERPVDLTFSTATFHWIKHQDRLFRRLAQALKPQGRLVA